MVAWDMVVGLLHAAGRAPSWCTVCPLGRWMATPPFANVLVVVDGSPPPMLMGGVRFSNGRSLELRPLRP
jgi:hypothetical protein